MVPFNLLYDFITLFNKKDMLTPSDKLYINYILFPQIYLLRLNMIGSGYIYIYILGIIFGRIIIQIY